MSDNKSSETKSVGALIMRYLSAPDGPMPITMSLTDEQWAEHDARVAVERAKEAAEEAADQEARRYGRLTKAGFPQRALDAVRTADEAKSAIARIKTWDPEKSSVLVLSGAAGCGKTVAATWWALRHARSTIFVRASTFAASSRYDRETRAAWFAASAMVLDDLGTEYLDAKGSFLVDLDELIDVYYGDRKPLIITTNCKAEVFGKRYGERIVDRIRECGVFFAASGGSLRSDKL